jgi:DNA-binding transcriptional ArsR family regulator
MPRDEFVNAERWLRENLLARVLLERSHLNEKTLKALLLHSWSKGATFEEISKRLRMGQPGAWKKWKRGRDLLMRSFYTIELAIYAGILDVETAEFIIDDLLDYVSLARGEGNVNEIRDRIERRMVQLAQRTFSKRT